MAAETPKFFARAWDWGETNKMIKLWPSTDLRIGHVVAIGVDALGGRVCTGWLGWLGGLRLGLGLGLGRGLGRSLGSLMGHHLLGRGHRRVARRRDLEGRVDVRVVARRRAGHGVEGRAVGRDHAVRVRRHHVRIVSWLGGRGRSGPEGVGGGGLLELETGRRGGRVDRADVDALARTDFVQLVELKPWDMALEQGLTLRYLVLDALGVPPRGQCLAVAVLLVARCARRRTRCASWMLRVALYRRPQWSVNSMLEIAAGVPRRDLPLFSCSYISHTPRAIVAAVEVQTTTAYRRPPSPLFSAVCSSGAPLVVSVVLAVVAAVAVAGVGAGWGPSAVQIAAKRAGPGRATG